MGSNKEKQSRRSMLKSLFTGMLTAGAGFFGVSYANAESPENEKKETKYIGSEETSTGKPPLFSSTVVHDGLVYVSGIGYHEEGDIKKATTEVLNVMEEKLEEAGSSMNSVLKSSVFLNDLNDYEGLNEAYRGRFGENPPVRTTVATYGGVPGDSLVEIDCIAALE